MTAAQCAGIHVVTSEGWRRLGNQALEENPETGPQELGSHAVFTWAVKAAEAELVEAQLANVHRDANNKGGWAAAMTLLERRRPQDFGRSDKRYVEQVSVSVNVSLPAGPGMELLEIVRRGLESGRKALLPGDNADSTV